MLALVLSTLHVDLRNAAVILSSLASFIQLLSGFVFCYCLGDMGILMSLWPFANLFPFRKLCNVLADVCQFSISAISARCLTLHGCCTPASLLLQLLLNTLSSTPSPCTASCCTSRLNKPEFILMQACEVWLAALHIVNDIARCLFET